MIACLLIEICVYLHKETSHVITTHHILTGFLQAMHCAMRATKLMRFGSWEKATWWQLDTEEM